jgi:hypothetical protein
MHADFNDNTNVCGMICKAKTRRVSPKEEKERSEGVRHGANLSFAVKSKMSGQALG